MVVLVGVVCSEAFGVVRLVLGFCRLMPMPNGKMNVDFNGHVERVGIGVAYLINIRFGFWRMVAWILVSTWSILFP